MTENDSLELLRARLPREGWAVVPSSLDGALLDTLAEELEPALQLRQRIRGENGVEGANDGTLHHLLLDHPCFMQLLAALERFDPVLRWYFSGNYVLNSYGGVINRQDTTAYVHAIHRDIRFSSDVKRFMLNVLVMLDEFTLANGATHLLSGSQLSERPEPELFLRSADRALGPRGSILFFDSRLWHATGRSTVAAPRRALTLTFTSPFFKPQLDYPRLVGYERGRSLPPFLQQVIGFNARVPASLQEYYLPVAQRFYQRGQDD